MQLIPTESQTAAAVAALRIDSDGAARDPRYAHYKVIRRNGAVVGFEPTKISVAVTKAFLAVNGSQGAASARVREQVAKLTEQVVTALMRRQPGGGTLHIEDIQDQVELALMRSGEHDVARAYVLYREERARLRAQQKAAAQTEARPQAVSVVDGELRRPLDLARLQGLIADSCEGLGPAVEAELILQSILKDLYDGVPIEEVRKCAILSARALIEKDPAYSFVTARLLLNSIQVEVLGEELTHAEMHSRYAEYFPAFIEKGIGAGLLDARLRTFDLATLAHALAADRDFKFGYLGLQTLYDRYFIHVDGRRIELPQAFFMRVAMGLALNETQREARAIEFYNVLSNFEFMSSTPTLFNSGTHRSQLSSCYLTTVADDLEGIYDAIKENALLSKFAGGLGNDWTPVRALGSHIKGTNGKSQGVVPFLKVVNDTAVAVNQCFAPDTPVYTADGLKPIRDVKAGDLVLGKSGAYRAVTRTFVYNQRDPMLALHLAHSPEPLKVTAAHPLYAIRGLGQSLACIRSRLRDGQIEAHWVEAGQLAPGDYVAQVVPTEVVPAAGFTQDDARLYGILLGGGELSEDAMQWAVSGPAHDAPHLSFVRHYLTARAIRFSETDRGQACVQIHWASGHGAVRDGTTGRFTGSGAPTLPFHREDLYDQHGRKRIARRFSHLPPGQTLAMLRGLLATGSASERGKALCFTSASRPLLDGVRYQLLRLRIATAGQRYRSTRARRGAGSAGSTPHASAAPGVWNLRIPAVPQIAALIKRAPSATRNWIEHQGHLFTPVRRVEPTAVNPFVMDLKVEVDASYMTAAGLAHNGGKRKGAVCSYLETWHLDIEEFLELRKNTGDDRRRTHDMNTANWVPDLFMKRVMENGEWTLFSPSDCPELHDSCGAGFEKAYVEYERRVAAGEIKLFKKIPAVQLWRKMLSMLFETGHPWITFKDPCNIRSPQQHVGVVHSSNLCTEITLNTSASEIAVCNLGSVNLAAHMKGGKLDHDKLKATVATAMRMLDNVIDINYYAVDKARNSNLKHRPVGLGIMGFQDCLHMMRVPYASREAVEFADRSMEAVAYYAYWASTELAQERGAYSTFEGSLWHRGILPQDTLALLRQERGGYVEVDTTSAMDWSGVRARIRQFGMRNSNCLAIAPTATIANIVGVSASIEPTYQNLYVKSNLSGEFTVVNDYLVQDLKRLGIWDEVMVADLKYFDGSLAKIDRIPPEVRKLYATAFEIDPVWLVEAAARRQKWIDQAQSLNLYMAGASGKKLDETYKHAWLRGLKTTYYLRTLAATHAEKSTVKAGSLNAVPSDGGAAVADAMRASAPLDREAEAARFCAIDDPTCEACQ